MNSLATKLMDAIRSHEASVGVIGLGYVGLPLSMVLAEKGFKILGFDVDRTKVEALLAGKSYIKHLPAARVEALLRSRFFGATDDFQRLGEPDVLIICVPTPLTAQRDPDMTYVAGTTEKIKARLRRGQLVILESTTYPGTTDELVRRILEETGLAMGSDFFLAFSPEREDPGNPNFGTANIPKVVGGVDEVSGDLAQALYDQGVTRTVRVSSARAAEATKLTENIFRAVNIALVNELKMIYDSMGIDIWEILDAAETKPFGFMRFNPGPGWGGHCIPLDPFYLSWKAREFGQLAKFIELAGEINTAMPKFVIGKLQDALNAMGTPMKGAKILLLGLAYKKDIDDIRESPSLEIMALLERLGARLSYHDPHVPEVPSTRHFPERKGMKSLPLTESVVAAHDAVLIVTDHSAVDYELIARCGKLVVDTRGIYRRTMKQFGDKVINA